MVVRELITKMGFKIDKEKLEKFNKSVGKAGKAMRGTSLVAAGLGFGMIKTAASFESMVSQFETLLGSGAKARQLFADLKTFSAQTPFQLPDLVKGTQRLLAFGIQQKDVIGIMKQLGDTAGGDAMKLDSLTRAFGKVNAKGKASMEEINMAIDAGVPILAALQKEMGVNETQLFKMVSAGKVTSAVFQNAFTTMTGAGGQFEGGMERASKTTAGTFSTMLDNIKLLAGSIGTLFLPIIKQAITFITDLAQSIENSSDTTKFLIGTLFALIAVLAPTLLLVSKMVGAILVLQKATWLLTGAKKAWAAVQWLVNAAMSAGLLPILAIIAVVVLFAGLAFLVIKNWDKVVRFFRGFWKNIVKIWTNIWNFLKGLWTDIKDFFISIWESIVSFFERVKNKLIKFITEMPIGFKILAGSILLVTAPVLALVGGFALLIKNKDKLIKKFKQFKKESGVFKKLAGSVKGFVSAIKNFFLGIKDSVLGVFNDIGNGILAIWQDITNKTSAFVEDIKSLFSGLTDNSAVRFFAGASPATAGATAGAGAASNIARPGSVSNKSVKMINVNSTINTSVPPGTTEGQKKELAKVARKAAKAEWDKNLRDLGLNNPEVE